MQVVFWFDLDCIRVIRRKTELQMETAARGKWALVHPPTTYRLHHPRQPRHAQTLTYTQTWIRGVRSDNRQADLASRWSRSSKKSRAAHEKGWGFCVCGLSHFITRESCNRPGKSFEAWGGCVGIASVATSDVRSNIPIACYFPD